LKTWILQTVFAILALLSFSQSSAGENNSDSEALLKADQLVEQMRGHSMMRSASGINDDGTIDPVEQHKQQIEDGLRKIGKEAVPALVQALRDPDVHMRRNAELVMISLAGPYEGKPQVDIQEALPALVEATRDSDGSVRAWAAGAIAEMGPKAKKAIPALIKLVTDHDEGARNDSCIALGRIGPAAKDALPTLRNALKDPNRDVRRFAQIAIDKIEK
jgi:HEAT repeat protein